MTEVHQFVTLLPAKPLEVKAANLDPDQYWVEGKSEGYGWRDTSVSFSGYFGSYGPHVFAAAPDLLDALKLFVRAEKMARDGNPPQDADRLIEIGDAAIAKAEERT